MILHSSHIQALKNIVGEENISVDPAILSTYSYDSTRLQKMPSCVIFPRDGEDVRAIISYAYQHKLPITPRGAGSGMSGGSINEGIILALQKYMNKILHIDTQNLCVTLQPAVINSALNHALLHHNLFFPPDPASASFSTIGGNIIENAGGMCAVKYGVSKDYLLSAKLVIGTGEMIEVGHNTYKDVAGYNLLGLLCGSEGSLGVITELTLKLKVKPKFEQSLLIGFASLKSLADCSCEILASGITPCAMEFLDTLTTQALNTSHQLYPQNSQAILIIKLDGNFAPSLQYELEEIAKISQAYSPTLFEVAKSKEEEAKIWFGRKNASQANSIYGVKKLNEDITLPRSKVAEFLQATQTISQKYNLPIPCFGHIGDGNIHTNVMLPRLEDLSKGKEAVNELFSLALAMGGTLSGEHGIGLSKAPYMPLAFSQTQLELFARIKHAFDPCNILNPHKMGF